MKKNRLFIDCHQDIAYSIRANKREFDTDKDSYMISLESLTNSKLNIIFSTIFVSHLEKKHHHKEAIAQIHEYEKIFKNYKNKFFKIQSKKDLKIEKIYNKINVNKWPSRPHESIFYPNS